MEQREEKGERRGRKGYNKHNKPVHTRSRYVETEEGRWMTIGSGIHEPLGGNKMEVSAGECGRGIEYDEGK